MNVLAEFKKVTTFIFDIDGVLTDSTVLVLENGLQARRMNIKDGLGLQMAIRNGFKVATISGSFSEPVMQRLKKLGIEDVQMSVVDKKSFVESYLEKNRLSWEQVLYMADDLPDLAVMKMVGLPCCPADAVPEILELSKYISPVNGGYGCVRDVIEKVLRVQDKWIFYDDVVSK
ncbi:MAG TPA: 3-deoxy-D-manno-octulosonate 8-phosphate phosphatase [Chitinophagaceae bacterium]|jgi:3-deoxy-D-manno-octulosonate 8-phosphate phosphatase (KDO 8-P phosphatase)|nr:3-deoxy-D-manno-octulosonate 8-phosphate phosphatase [Chitinophagaceae bacterium]